MVHSLYLIPLLQKAEDLFWQPFYQELLHYLNWSSLLFDKLSVLCTLACYVIHNSAIEKAEELAKT